MNGQSAVHLFAQNRTIYVTHTHVIPNTDVIHLISENTDVIEKRTLTTNVIQLTSYTSLVHLIRDNSNCNSLVIITKTHQKTSLTGEN